MPLRILCLGYSVTERPGYVERANALAAAEGRDILFLKSGWGGHSLPTVAYMIDEILDWQPCDFVLLELFTGDVRSHSRRRMRLYLDEILSVTARRRLPVAFLNLYQGGVDYRAEPIAGLLEEYRALYGIPCLDIASTLATMTAGELAALLKDGTHVTPAGADLYGRLVHDYLRVPPQGSAHHDDFRRLPLRFASLPLRTLPGLDCAFELERHGVPLRFLEIPEGVRATIELGRAWRVLGVMVTFGPTSGWMWFRSGRSDVGVCAYDAASYYTRSFLMPIHFRSTRRFRVIQMSYRPDIPLRKGAPSHAPRVGRLSHVFCQRKQRMQERLALLHHRLRHRLGVLRRDLSRHSWLRQRMPA